MGTIVDDVERGHLAAYPEQRELLLPFLAGFDVTWAKQRIAFGSELSVYLLKPERHMTEAFGFELEVLLVYSKYESLQPRTVQAAEQFLSDSPAHGRADRLTFFLVSEEARPREWVQSYVGANPDSRLIVAFAADELRDGKGDSWLVRNVLAGQLYQRDLFDHRLPLRTDTSFFGRESLAFDLFHAVRRSENRGLFGLRKTGKTSLMFKARRLLESAEPSVPSLYYDCKFPVIRTQRWTSLLNRITRDIVSTFGIPSPGEQEPADAFLAAIASIPRDRRLALMFDEIEYVSPFTPLDPHWGDDFIPFWQTVWSAQSLHGNTSVIVAGVNPAVVETDLIRGVQNPLFGIFPHQYLTGLTGDELRQMVRTLGKRVGLRFEFAATEYLHLRYGGHPLLTRIACSLTHRAINEARTPRPLDITTRFLTEREDARDADLVFYCRHVVSELQLFYPDEYEVLEKLATGQVADFIEFTRAPEFSGHLRNYGLLRQDDLGRPTIAIPVVGRFVGLEAARKDGRRTILAIAPATQRQDWLTRRLESIRLNLEFFERQIDRARKPSLFGVNSFPEADRFMSLPVVADETTFGTFINICNRCFVESIEAYGRTVANRPNYFWDSIKTDYPALFDALHRIKLYRHHRAHLRLNPGVDQALNSYLRTDLEGRTPAEVGADLWFTLQQCVLDGLLTGIMIETERITS